MEKFMNLPSLLLEELNEKEMLLLTGGDTPPVPVNNGAGFCKGINNYIGRCESNINNGNGVCELPPV